MKTTLFMCVLLTLARSQVVVEAYQGEELNLTGEVQAPEPEGEGSIGEPFVFTMPEPIKTLDE